MHTALICRGLLRHANIYTQIVGCGALSSLPVALSTHSQPPNVLLRLGFSTKSDTDKIERLLDVLGRNPQMQQMMLSSFPPHLRKPEMIQALLASPEAKRKVAEMIERIGFAVPTDLLDRMNDQTLSESMEKAKAMGVDPTQMFQRLMSQPKLAEKMRNPRVMRAFYEITTNPSSLEHYRDDPEVLEVYHAAKDLLLPKPFSQPAETPVAAIQMPPSAPTAQLADAQATLASSEVPSPTSPPPSTTSAAKAQGSEDLRIGGLSEDRVMKALLEHPELAAAMSKPRVQAAVLDMQQRPWTVMRYWWDKEVWGAVKAMRELTKRSQSGPSS